MCYEDEQSKLWGKGNARGDVLLFYKKHPGLATLVRWHLNIHLKEVRKVFMWLSGERPFSSAKEPAKVKALCPGHTWCVLWTARMPVRLGRCQQKRTGKEKKCDQQGSKTTEDIIGQGKGFGLTLNRMRFLCFRVSYRLWTGQGGCTLEIRKISGR